MSLSIGQMRCGGMLAAAILHLSSGHDPEEWISADDFAALDHGVEATLIHPSGDRYRILVEWIGDTDSMPGGDTE